MTKTIVLVLVSAFFLTGCTLGFAGGHRPGSLVVIPALPLMVEIDAAQPYYQNGYYYDYQGSIWMYSVSRQGPWARLPRTHYPREVRHRGQGGNGFDHDNGVQGR